MDWSDRRISCIAGFHIASRKTQDLSARRKISPQAWPDIGAHIGLGVDRKSPEISGLPAPESRQEKKLLGGMF